jgi:hypothetical protein
MLLAGSIHSLKKLRFLPKILVGKANRRILDKFQEGNYYEIQIRTGILPVGAGGHTQRLQQ